MPTARRRALLPLLAAAAALPLATPAARAAGAGGPLKAVFQVSDGDPHKWTLALNNLRNVSDDLGGDMAVELELVVYGPGIGMLKAGSPVAARVAEAQKNGVKVVACENTMKAQQLTYADMLPNLGYVPAGVVELIKKQHAGWAYIRP